jgi:hypothetical protein
VLRKEAKRKREKRKTVEKIVKERDKWNNAKHNIPYI